MCIRDRSDHVVIDDDLETIHVFTGLEVKEIPEKRLKFLYKINLN